MVNLWEMESDAQPRELRVNQLCRNVFRNYARPSFVDQMLEVDRNRNFLPGTRNLPGIRFPVPVPGFEIFKVIGYWLGSWF